MVICYSINFQISYSKRKKMLPKEVPICHKAWNLKCLSWGISPSLVSFNGLNSESEWQLLWISTNWTSIPTNALDYLKEEQRSKVGKNEWSWSLPMHQPLLQCTLSSKTSLLRRRSLFWVRLNYKILLPFHF